MPKKIRNLIIMALAAVFVLGGIFSLQIEPAEDVDNAGAGQNSVVTGEMIDDEPVDEILVEGNEDNVDAPADELLINDEPVNENSAAETVVDDEPVAEPVINDEPVDEPAVKEEKHICTLEIRCDTLVDLVNVENEAIIPYIPADGVVLATTEVEFTLGESVFDILQRVTREKGIQMEFRDDSMYSGKYIEGINYLYDMDAGSLSGWMYNVNGQFPNYGCARYEVADNDAIVWMYTCDLGRDVGDNSVW